LAPPRRRFGSAITDETKEQAERDKAQAIEKIAAFAGALDGANGGRSNQKLDAGRCARASRRGRGDGAGRGSRGRPPGGTRAGAGIGVISRKTQRLYGPAGFLSRSWKVGRDPGCR